MAVTPRVVVVPAAGAAGGSSAAGILLLLVAIVGLLALFTGNLDRILEGIGAPAGGPEGLGGVYGGGRVRGGSWGEPVTGAAPAPATRPVRTPVRL